MIAVAIIFATLGALILALAYLVGGASRASGARDATWATAAWGALYLIVAAIFALAWLVTPTPARAHDALPTAAQPQGWSYPFSCCSGYDCRAVPQSAISEKPEGFVVPSGEVVAYSDKRVKDSPDGEFHWCSVAGKNDGQTICLFVPPRSF